ncbi:DNA-directed RNA polymerase [Cutibacterium acnes JCM 18909]|nr:DNA-directed RNA polymerase [Cutibacterium acnes JCM 18909]
MAATRTASKNTSAISPQSGRISFAKIHEPLEVPNLLDLQVESFNWLVGNEIWQSRVDAALAEGRTDINTKSGLEEIFEEISPIEDYSQTMSLSFRDHRFEDPKHSVDECKDRDTTYAAPLFVTAEFMNNETEEIKSQTVFIGDFPLMTSKGTFIINGTERVVVSQLVRSPGVYFEKTADKTSDKDIFTCKVIPSRGAWLEFEIDKRDTVGVRLDRKRKQNVTVFLKALGWTATGFLRSSALMSRSVRPLRRIMASRPRTRLSLTSTRSCAPVSRRPVTPRSSCSRITTSTRSATTWPRLVGTRSTRSSVCPCPSISRF